MKENKKRTIDEKLIDIIKSSIPKGQLPADVISDIISIHRESAYRRLRGQIKFSFEEVARINEELRLPLEQILSVNELQYRNNSSLRVDLITDSEDSGDYCKSIYDTMMRINKENNLCYAAMNTIPFSFIFPYKYLSCLHYYKWISYNPDYTGSNKSCFSELPEKIRIRQQAIHELCQSVDSIYIFSDSIFTSLYKEIKYFQFLQLITDEDMIALKGELHSLISKIENISNIGKFENDTKISIYLSNIDVENTYICVEPEDKKEPYYTLHALNKDNYILSEDSHLYSLLRNSFEILRKNATLITRSGAKQRMDFIYRQRQIIDQL